MRFSVVVSTYDITRIDDLQDCVRSVLEQSYSDFEVIVVVDNNRRLFWALRERYAQEAAVRVILNDANRGLSSCMNCGVLEARGQIVCFVDDDAVADENWLSELAREYDIDVNTWGVGGRIKPLWAGKKLSYLPDEFYWMIGATNGRLTDQVKEVRNLWSGNASYRREAFDRFGLFLRDLGKVGNSLLQGEDAEFGLRISRATGKGLEYVPTAVVFHKVYDYRLKLRSLLKRAYQQGCAKGYLVCLYGDVGVLSAERGYMKLVLGSTVGRLKQILFGPCRIRALKQQVFAIMATAAVLLGFGNALIREKLRSSVISRQVPPI